MYKINSELIVNFLFGHRAAERLAEFDKVNFAVSVS
jgi:hypothetical protein